MFKGIVTKTVKEMVFDPIMNPEAPAKPDAAESSQVESKTTSEFDPDAFDQVPGTGSSTYDPDSFDQVAPPRRHVAPSRHRADPAQSRDLIAETWDIQLPFYPGEGTSCGDACRCTWLVERHWSQENGCNAIFATWIATAEDAACPECQQRASEWNAVFIRPSFDDE
jgi:hypothetical protein